MLNITKKIYAAWSNTQKKYELPEAEIIPSGTSGNEKRKLSNARSRATDVVEYDNVPLPGFTLCKTDRKNWGSIDQTWLVIDPRGFLVRITSENLEKILHVTGITEGLIQEKCIWARENSATSVTLVPVTSEIYAEAVKNTELLESKISIKEVQIGDTVLLQNKLQGTYLGCLSLYGPVGDYSKDNKYKPFTYVRRQIIEVLPGKFHYQSDIKILSVTKKTQSPMTKEQAVEYINKKISSGAYFTNSTNMSGHYYSTYGMITYASAHAVPKPILKYEEISRAEAEILFDRAEAIPDFGMLVLEKPTGTKYLVDFPFSGSKQRAKKDSFDVCELLKGKPLSSEMLELNNKRQSYWNRSGPAFTEKFDNFTKFYKIVKCVKNETYI